MSAAEKPELVEHRVVAGGRRTIAGGGLGVVLYPIVDGKLDESQDRIFAAKKALRHAVAGGVYTIKGNADLSTAVLDSARYRERWKEEWRVAEWTAADEAAVVSDRLRRDEKAERRRDVLADLLAPIRREYRKADSTGRAAIEVAVLNALRRPLAAGERY